MSKSDAAAPLVAPAGVPELEALFKQFEQAKNWSHGQCGCELPCRMCPAWETLKTALRLAAWQETVARLRDE